MADLTISEIILSFIYLLEITSSAQIFRLVIPRYTRSRKYVYRVIKDLERLGKIRLSKNGRGKLIKVKGFRRRQVEHDLGTNGVVIAFMLACWELNYPFEQYFNSLDGWKPDKILGFHKGTWRLVGIEYQKSPLTKRRWRNKFDRIKAAIKEIDYPVYVLVVAKTGMYYSEHYIKGLASLANHPDFYFTTERLVNETPPGQLLTSPIFYHVDEKGRIPIFYKE